jgi:CubicO group peptidase (beta-lactamase class C family)
MLIDYTPLQKQILRLMDAQKLKGLAISVVDGNAICYADVFGRLNSSSHRPLTAETQFQGASLSKPVFAYAVLKLCETGVLDLDTPLIYYRPEPPCEDPRALQITARHVLSHTPGFPNWREEDEGTLRIHSDPGRRFGYSGEGFQYLQQVLEYLTGQPLYEYMDAHLLTPLGMRHSTYAWASTGQEQPIEDEDGNVVSVGEQLMSNAAFSLLTTAQDYARFLLAMLNPVEDDPHRLNRASVDAMLTPQIQVGNRANLAWGLGWGIQYTEAGDAGWHWGGGHNDCYNYAVIFVKQRKGVTILTKGGLRVCESIAQMALAIDVHHPAFDWLLPEDGWQSSG